MQIEREVQSFEGYVFGHFDSRGGSTLVQASNCIEAIQKYVKGCFDVGPGDDYWDSSVDSAMEELEVLQVHVCDQELPRTGELLVSYGGKYSFARIEQRFKGHEALPWTVTNHVVLWVDNGLSKDLVDEDFYREMLARAPAVGGGPEAFHEYRLTGWTPGEDAFGLVVL